MNRFIQGLTGFLLLQLLVAVVLLWNGHDFDNRDGQQPLLAVNVDSIDRVVISGPDQQATLFRSSGNWQLPKLDNLPVSDNLDSVLKRLAQLKKGWPVTTSQSSHERFEVAEDKFQRRIKLYQGDKQVGDLLLGSSPGFHKVYARQAGADEIYAVELSNYEVPDDDQKWLDKSLLAATDVSAIKARDFDLVQENKTWRLAADNQAPPDQSGSAAADAKDEPDGNVNLAGKVDLDVKKAEQLAHAIGALKVTGMAPSPPEFSPENAVVLEVTGKDHWTYKFVADKEKYYVQRNDRGAFFTLGKSDYERIAGVSQADLISTENNDKTANIDTGKESDNTN